VRSSEQRLHPPRAPSPGSPCPPPLTTSLAPNPPFSTLLHPLSHSLFSEIVPSPLSELPHRSLILITVPAASSQELHRSSPRLCSALLILPSSPAAPLKPIVQHYTCINHHVKHTSLIPSTLSLEHPTNTANLSLMRRCASFAMSSTPLMCM